MIYHQYKLSFVSLTVNFIARGLDSRYLVSPVPALPAPLEELMVVACAIGSVAASNTHKGLGQIQ